MPACLQALRKESPRLGGSFANWGLTFSCFDCSMQYIRKKVRACVHARRHFFHHRNHERSSLVVSHHVLSTVGACPDCRVLSCSLRHALRHALNLSTSDITYPPAHPPAHPRIRRTRGT